jgi:hypothetical protein
MRNNLMAGYPAAVKVLESSLLAGLEAAYFTIYFLDGLSPFEQIFTLTFSACIQEKRARVRPVPDCLQP